MTGERTFIAPELIKNKYYKAEEVNTLLKNCGEVLEALRNENKRLQNENKKLKKETSSLTQQKTQVSDTLTSSKILARQIISEATKAANSKLEEADAEATKILKKANTEAKTILEEARRKKTMAYACMPNSIDSDSMLEKAAESFTRLKQQQLDLLESMDSEWQHLLLSVCGKNVEEENKDEDELPSDLSEKLSAIASQLRLFEIDEEELEDENE